MDGKWRALGERRVYEDDGLNVDIFDVELHDGSHIDHRVVIQKHETSVGSVVYEAEKGVLLLWRHQFATDTWGWEVPATDVGRGETLEQAGERITLSTTGWRPTRLKKFLSYHPLPALTATRFHCCFSDGATWVGPGRELNQVADLTWTPVQRIPELIEKQEISEGLTLTALLYAISLGPLA